MKKLFQKWFPLFLMLAMALWFFAKLSPVKDKDFAFAQFGELPVTANGRVQPLDSLARNALLQLREKQTLNLEPWKAWNEKPRIISAREWLANVMMNSTVADEWPAFRVDNPDLISLLKLPEKDAAKKSDGMKLPAWVARIRAVTAKKSLVKPTAAIHKAAKYQLRVVQDGTLPLQ